MKFWKTCKIVSGLVTVTKVARAARLLTCIRVGPRLDLDWKTDYCGQGLLLLQPLKANFGILPRIAQKSSFHIYSSLLLNKYSSLLGCDAVSLGIFRRFERS